ncbi:MAG: bifunctional ADP-dependent NAD(P)H-hydrate dehydratase/NAD(P)H-hydrate epimerase [Treponema sp.]|nr:bifunctional ADP-dependent NAD(P)H-hydrate dehydratase/NAD(P)H-hydrate epimerase [Treponema sp.]
MKGRGPPPDRPAPGRVFLAGAEAARALDEEASAEWGLSPFALVEAAGRNCARRFAEWYGLPLARLRVTARAGPGKNGADALVLLRALVLEHGLLPRNAAALLSRLPGPGEISPRAGAARALEAMGITVRPWDGAGEALLKSPHIIIDGIAGTGLSGPLRDIPLAMAAALNRAREGAGAGGEGGAPERPLVVSIDVPSGVGDAFRPPWPAVTADAVLAVEPVKFALYKPAARCFAGAVLPVGGIFPAALVEKYGGAELLGWESARARIPPVPPDACKYDRGVAEIRAGSAGSAGAARIAAKGAQAAGAGLVRLAVDVSLYPVLAVSAGGVMVFEEGSAADDSGRFRPDALLLGPGWGRGDSRKAALEAAIRQEGEGTPLVLDADAIALAKGRVFCGNTVLTPHPGELANFAGVSKEELAADPLSILKDAAGKAKAVILFKTAVLIIAGPEDSGHRLAVVDGMAPALGAGGSGDLLAGLCAGIAARVRAQSLRGGSAAPVDVFACAAAAAALLIASAGTPVSRRFADPLDLARAAAALAGDAWLPL